MATYDELVQSGMSRGEALRALTGSGVSAPAAMTAPATMAGAYTQAEVQALRTDVANLRTTVANLIAFINAGS